MRKLRKIIKALRGQELPYTFLDMRNEFISAGFNKDEAFELVKAILSHG